MNRTIQWQVLQRKTATTKQQTTHQPEGPETVNRISSTKAIPKKTPACWCGCKVWNKHPPIHSTGKDQPWHYLSQWHKKDILPYPPSPGFKKLSSMILMKNSGIEKQCSNWGNLIRSLCLVGHFYWLAPDTGNAGDDSSLSTTGKPPKKPATRNSGQWYATRNQSSTEKDGHGLSKIIRKENIEQERFYGLMKPEYLLKPM